MRSRAAAAAARSTAGSRRAGPSSWVPAHALEGLLGHFEALGEAVGGRDLDEGTAAEHLHHASNRPRREACTTRGERNFVTGAERP